MDYFEAWCEENDFDHTADGVWEEYLEWKHDNSERD